MTTLTHLLLTANSERMLGFQINVATLNNVIKKIRADLPNLEASEETDQISQHFNNTITSLKNKMQSQKENEGPSYKDLVLES